tara:strand:- start:207 stop:1172 length:966 start_codon:yes stop_codon:yes gene_type:complete
MSKSFLESAKRTLKIESEGINRLLENLDENFNDVCEDLLNCKGRIVTLGVGKSGHIANKISATLSSTGSSSFFVNAAEALHGDLGSITSEDIVIIFSHSGESQEIIDILPSLKNIGCGIFSITGSKESKISKESKLNLSTEIVEEACPNNLAPTTSTTASLALGDAIAVAILEAKGFTSDDFAKSHPGGKLGKRLLLKVSDIMHTGEAFPSVNEDEILVNSLMKMTEKGLGILVVLDESKNLSGVFTDGDLRRCINQDKNIKTTKVSEVMSKSTKTINRNVLAFEASKIMENHNIYSLVVMDDDKPIGVLRMHDLLQTGLI